jgi:hypothetical protein
MDPLVRLVRSLAIDTRQMHDSITPCDGVCKLSLVADTDRGDTQMRSGLHTFIALASDEQHLIPVLE